MLHCGGREGVSKLYFYGIVAVEGVSKLSFHCGSRDAKFCVSTTIPGKLLIFNVLCAIVGVETRRATSLQHQCRNFDTPPYCHIEMIILIHPLYNRIAHMISVDSKCFIWAKSHFLPVSR